MSYQPLTDSSYGGFFVNRPWSRATTENDGRSSSRATGSPFSPISPRSPYSRLTPFLSKWGDFSTLSKYMETKLTQLKLPAELEAEVQAIAAKYIMVIPPTPKTPKNYEVLLKEQFKLMTLSPLALSKEQERLWTVLKNARLEHLQRGTYLAGFRRPRTTRFHTAAIFKPTDEVRGIASDTLPAKMGVNPQFEQINEIAVATLAKLSQTVVMAKVSNRGGLAVSFLHDAQGIADKTPQQIGHIMKAISLEEMQKIMMLDIRFFNTDRNLGNLLIRGRKLYPIDNGLILPKGFESPAQFCWANFDHAKWPFMEPALSQIKALDFEKDRQIIQKLHMEYPVESLEVMRICYYFLKSGAENGVTVRGMIRLLQQSPHVAFEDSPIQSAYEIQKIESDPEETFQSMREWIDGSMKSSFR